MVCGVVPKDGVKACSLVTRQGYRQHPQYQVLGPTALVSVRAETVPADTSGHPCFVGNPIETE